MKIKEITRSYAAKVFKERFCSRDFYCEMTAEVEEGEDFQEVSKKLHEQCFKAVEKDSNDYLNAPTIDPYMNKTTVKVPDKQPF